MCFFRAAGLTGPLIQQYPDALQSWCLHSQRLSLLMGLSLTGELFYHGQVVSKPHRDVAVWDHLGWTENSPLCC